jgi:hypothetical protein
MERLDKSEKKFWKKRKLYLHFVSNSAIISQGAFCAAMILKQQGGATDGKVSIL